MEEIETLLKKAYTLMPAHEKKGYYVVKDDLPSTSPAYAMQVLVTFWEKLQKVGQLTFNAKTKSKEENGWNSKGQ